MKRIIVPLIATLLFASCSPLTYYLNIDVKNNSDNKINIDGKKISIFSITSVGDKDSILTSKIATGMAEKFEEDKGLAEGTIPVYSIFSEEIDYSSLFSLEYIATQSNSDIVFFLDSLSIKEYSVNSSGKNQVYADGDYYSKTQVLLPFSFKYFVYDAVALKPIQQKNFKDSMEWSLLGSKEMSRINAIAKANSTLTKVFSDIGSEIAASFSPQWETQSRALIYYENSDWVKACQLAEQFKWKEAMNIWLEEAKSSNPKRASYAAYNIAVACEMLEKYDLAYQWLDFAKTKYSFSGIETLRRNIQKSEDRKLL